MIRTTILTASLLLLTWSIMVNWLPEDLSTKQHQWNDNIIRAQDYIYTESEIRDMEVIIGSSLANRLDKDMLPENFTNLAFGGLSVLDGLNIVAASPAKPKTVFIETNLILRDQRESFRSTLLSPFAYHSKKYLNAMRDKNQPVGVLKGMLMNLSKRYKRNNKNNKKPFNQAALNRAKTSYSIPPSEEVLKATVTKVRKMIDLLEHDGVSIVFFEMPVHPELCNEVFPIAIRQYLENVFPPDKYQYLQKPDCSSYQTTDGAHLTESSAQKYSHFMNLQLKNTKKGM